MASKKESSKLKKLFTTWKLIYPVGGSIIVAAMVNYLITFLPKSSDNTTETVQHLTESYTEIIFDISKEMAEKFGSRFKLDAAREVVKQKFNKINSDQVALRTFGGPCGGEGSNTDLVVNFDLREKIKSKIDNALIAIDANSLREENNQATLADAILSAAKNDFPSSTDSKTIVKNILVIAGGVGNCHSRPATYLKEQLEIHKLLSEVINWEINLIGLAIKPDQRHAFREIAEITRHGKVLLAQNQDELNLAIEFPELAHLYLAGKDARDYNNADSLAVSRLKYFIKDAQNYEKLNSWVAEANRYLGDIYADDTKPHDEVEAFNHYQKGADLGNVEAMFQLGLAFQHGWGVDSSSDDAFTWFSKAGSLGHDAAQSKLNQLSGR